MKPDELHTASSLPFRIAASYMLVNGIVSLIWPLLNIGPNNPEFEAPSLAFRVGGHTREIVFAVAFIIAGIGLFLHHGWARLLALIFLLLTTVYTASAFARGFSDGPPSVRVYLVSGLIVAAWNGLWFYLIYRTKLSY